MPMHGVFGGGGSIVLIWLMVPCQFVVPSSHRHSHCRPYSGTASSVC
jgi:hypothetical protein